MGYSGPYDLKTRCGAEILATGMALYLGCATVANGLLPGAKGQGMGFGFISFGYGFAFFFSSLCFGAVSSLSNPALGLANVILGNLDAGDFFALSASQVLGAFLGAVLCWMHWAPHFKTVPEPPSLDMSDALLRRRDNVSRDAVQIASYNTDVMKRVNSDKHGAADVGAWWRDVSYYLGTNNRYRGPRRRRHLGSREAMLGQRLMLEGSSASLAQQSHPYGANGDAASIADSNQSDHIHEYSQYELQQRFLEDELQRQAFRSGQTDGPEHSQDSTISVLPDGSVDGGAADGAAAAAAANAAPVSVRIDIESLYTKDRVAGGHVAGGGGMAGVHQPPTENGAKHHSYTFMPDGRTYGEMSGGEDAAMARPPPKAGSSGSAASLARLTAPLAGQGGSSGSLEEYGADRRTAMGRLQHGQGGSDGALSERARGLSRLSHRAGGSSDALSTLAEKHERSSEMGLAPARGAGGGSSGGGGGVRTRHTQDGEVQRSVQSFGSGMRVRTPVALSSSFTSRHGLHPPVHGPGAVKKAKQHAVVKKKATLMEQERERLKKLYQAAVIADQNVKLSVFATRPGIYSPLFNLLCEFLSTIMLLGGILLIQERADHFLGNSADVYRMLMPFYTGLYIVVCSLGLGGPTGLACNPARDLGPRIAHYLLPIPNKGPSEWHYGWIPFIADFAGGAVAGVLFIVMRNMQFDVRT